MAIPLPVPSRTRIASSAVALTHTGNTDETALVSVVIPPLGPNDQISVTLLWTYTSSGNTKAMRARYDTDAGASGTVVCANSATTTAADRDTFIGGNRNATNSQIWGMFTGGAGGSSSANVTTTRDTTAVTYLNITAQLADAGESITLEQYLVELIRVP